MSKKVTSFIYNLLCFAVLFILTRYLVEKYTTVTGYFIPLTAFVISTLIAPKFQAIQTANGEKIFMRWLFIKGVREIG